MWCGYGEELAYRTGMCQMTDRQRGGRHDDVDDGYWTRSEKHETASSDQNTDCRRRSPAAAAGASATTNDDNDNDDDDVDGGLLVRHV